MATMTPIRLSEALLGQLRCPACAAPLTLIESRLECLEAGCQALYPVVDGIPILINERASVFSISDFLRHERTTYRPKSRLEQLIADVVPEIGVNLKAESNYARLARLLTERSAQPRVLVVGGSVVGRGMQALLNVPSIELVESDVTFSPRTTIIADAHDLPFADATFDGLIIQAVLEHVLDPVRCIQEARRVLKPGGLVYAETPFMQQVHGGPYDFTRFTHLGHRRLFRAFDEVESGAVCGPGMALAWAYQYFLLSFVEGASARAAVKVFARLTAFWLKFLDRFLINRPGALDAASGYFFLGQCSDRLLDDRTLLGLYRGAGQVLPMRAANGHFS